MKALFTIVAMSLILAACTTYETKPAPTTSTTTVYHPAASASSVTTSTSN